MTEKNPPNPNDCPGDLIGGLPSVFRRHGYVRTHDVRYNFVVKPDGNVYQHVDDIKSCPDPAQHECGRGSCWKGEGHDGPCEPSGRPTHEEELRAAVERAEKAEQEAARLKDSRDTWSRYAKERSMTIKEQAALIDALRAEQPRTVEVTAEMIERAWAEMVKSPGWRVGVLHEDGPAISRFLTAALTEPEPRPEGAEELDGHVDASLRGVGLHPLNAEEIRIVADNLAAEGVRAPEEDR